MNPAPAPEYDVAIVGYGPTGGVLAKLLGQRGWRVALLDREPGLLNLPRAVHFDGEVMRIFDAAGIANALRPLVRASQGMQYLDTAGRLMLERKPAGAAGLHGWANNYLFHQPDLELALRDAVARHACVTPFLGHEVESVVQDPDLVTLHARDLVQATQRQLRARWLVGCDGGRSTVREVLGSALTDLGLHQSWLVVDVLLEREVALPVATVQFCDPRRPMTYVNVTGRRRRWEIMLMPGDDSTAMTQPDALWAMLSRWIRPGDATLVRHAIYTFHALVADRWRDRRLLLAGDSAHQTPPFLGQGMCAGVRDASNLAWKLDLVLRGADAALLDTYQSERAPHVLEYIQTAVRLGNIIQTTDPKVAAARDRQFAEGGPQEIVNLSPPLGPGLHGGSGCAGTLPGQPRLRDGRWLDAALGSQFALLCATDAITCTLQPQDLARLDALGTQWLIDASLEHWLRQLDAKVIVLRPDRYVFGSASTVDELRRLIARLPMCTHAAPAARPVSARQRGALAGPPLDLTSTASTLEGDDTP